MMPGGAQLSLPPDATLVAPRRPVKTYTDHSGREVYTDTGRPVDERLGSHIVLWIVDDPDAWAGKIEADADEVVARYPKDRIAPVRRAQAYESAARIRAEGPGRSWYGHYYSAQTAQATVTGLRRSHPNPGVRYEVAEIAQAGVCPECHCPTVYADGQWRHHLGRYPAQCIRHPEPEPATEEPRQDGEFEISTRGYMICGYCGQTEGWSYAILRYVELTGFHLLGVERATGELVVLAEATTLSGKRTVLPHHCEKIPDDVRATYAADITEIRARLAGRSDAEVQA
jgi:hypothetical protein